MAQESDVRLGNLARFIFTAPSWQRSLFLIALLGFVIDGAGVRSWVIFPVSPLPFSGTFAFTLPAIVAFALTKPLIELQGKTMTWNRSALLALAGTVCAVIITLSCRVSDTAMLPYFYAAAISFVFGFRILVLAAIADYRIPRILGPAFTHSGAGILAGMILFFPAFFLFALVLHIVFGAAFILLIWLIERPLYRAFQIRGLAFINAFIAHMTDGSKGMEQFFRDIGEEIFVPQVCLFFRRGKGKDVLVTVPNLHPGPMGEIGGGNLPKIVHDYFGEETLVPHGCATHDFNLVAESEIEKVIDAIQATKTNLSYAPLAAQSGRVQAGSVSVLYQRFSDTVLMVATRSPQRTEDLDYGIGMAIMSEGHRFFPHVAFVDAHNCMTDLSSPIHLGTLTATEYLDAARKVFERCRDVEIRPFRAGICHQLLPFSREQGFGDLGVQVLVIETGGQKTGYVLLDGNNMAQGVREQLREQVLTLVDDAEIMTTDSHVVNTITGKNPVGQNVPAQDLAPLVLSAVREAIDDLSPAQVAGSTAQCGHIVVFGSTRITQFASTVNAILVFIAPLALAFLLLAFLLSLFAYIVIA